MLINVPEKRKLVEAYDFCLTNGVMLPITLDRELGDTIDFTSNPLAVTILLTAKPSLTDPNVVLPREEITVYANHIMTVQKRIIEVTELTPNQQEAWKQTILDISKTLQ